MAGQTVELSQLPIQHLETLRSQLEEEIKLLTDSMTQLKMAQQKFGDSMENMKKLQQRESGKQIMVPLTGSMYVPGTLENINIVLVDIGTGYFAEKTLKQAEEYFKRKVDFLTKQIENLQPAVIEKHKMRQAVLDVLSTKIQAQMAQGGHGIPART